LAAARGGGGGALEWRVGAGGGPGSLWEAGRRGSGERVGLGVLARFVRERSRPAGGVVGAAV